MTDSVEPAGQTASVSRSPGSPAPQALTQSSDHISTGTRRRSATAAGKGPPAVDCDWLRARWGPSIIFQASYNPAASPTAASGAARRRDPALADSPVCTVPLPSDRDHAEPMGTPPLRHMLLLVKRRLHLQGRMPSATLLKCGSLIPSRALFACQLEARAAR